MRERGGRAFHLAGIFIRKSEAVACANKYKARGRTTHVHQKDGTYHVFRD
ncbi:hypothetical protein [Methanomethylovorans sp. PtaU1.Bin093]|nr:hypothetical protein [Methanomethylovorans sp. PtaU1.Bin093]